MLRAVLDANVYASALVKPDGPPGRILHRLLADRAFEVVLSASILLELRRCLGYARLRKHISLSDAEIDRWLLALELIAETVTPRRDVRAVPDDPEDDHIVAAAIEGRSDFIVTGDRHILALGEYEGVRIVTPAAFLKVLGGDVLRKKTMSRGSSGPTPPGAPGPPFLPLVLRESASRRA